MRTSRRPSEPDPVSTGEGSHTCCTYASALPSRPRASPPWRRCPWWAAASSGVAGRPPPSRRPPPRGRAGRRHRRPGHPRLLRTAQEAGQGVRGRDRLRPRGPRRGRRRPADQQAGADQGLPDRRRRLRHRQHLRLAAPLDEGVVRRRTPPTAARRRAATPTPCRRGRRPADAGRLRRRLRQRRRQRGSRKHGLDAAAHPRRPDRAGVPGPLRHARRRDQPRPGWRSCSPPSRAYGDGWPDYWKTLMANGTKSPPGWSDAYEVDFTAGGGNGDRPIVLSYASSPPFTIPGARDRRRARCSTPASARWSTPACWRAPKNPAGAEALVDFMLSRRGPGGAAGQHVRLPGRRRAPPLPADWAEFAKPQPSDPYAVDPAEIDAEPRRSGCATGRDVTSR